MQATYADFTRLEPSEIYHPEGNLIWPEIRQRFEIPYNERRTDIQEQIRFYQSHKNFFYTVLETAAPYLSYIFEQTRSRDLPAELALIPLVESGFNAFAYSKAGAAGLWQLMPGTASVYGLRIDWYYDERRDLISSTHAALDYFGYLYNLFENDWVLAVAAYDSGEGTILNSLKNNLIEHESISYWNLKLPKETRDYLPKLFAIVSIIKHPQRYGMELPPVVSAPYFKVVEMDNVSHVPQVAKLAKINLETLYYLNPGYRRSTAGSKGNLSFLLPIDKADSIETKNKLSPTKTLADWQKVMVKAFSSAKLKTIAGDHQLGPRKYIHTVKKTDSFEDIAKKYEVKPMEIKFWNQMNADRVLKEGQQLIIWSKLKLKQRQLAYEKYQVKEGDNLKNLAKIYKTTVKAIKKANNLSNNNIVAGKTLKIPTYIITAESGV